MANVLVIKLLRQGNVVVEARGVINEPLNDKLFNDIWRVETTINERGRFRAHLSVESDGEVVAGRT